MPLLLHQEYALVVDSRLMDGVLTDAHKHLQAISEKVRWSRDGSMDAADLADLELLDDAIMEYIDSCKQRITGVIGGSGGYDG